jgi:phosphatidylserine decarboxylase
MISMWLHWWFILGVFVVIWLALVSFFRDPWRNIPTDLPAGTMLSPADGVISAIEFVDEHESTGTKSVIIRIFLSVLNVHINRAPCDCTVVGLNYREGKFLDARLEESARVNESNLITLRVGEETIGVRQISGKLAKRIVCPIEIDDTLSQGERFGMIKYGSTTELILPRPNDVTVLVAKGDKVYGGKTSLAMLSKA